MSINRVQFQKSLSMAEFFARYGNEEQCHAALVALRWADGFVCPDCGCAQHGSFVREKRRSSSTSTFIATSLKCSIDSIDATT